MGRKKTLAEYEAEAKFNKAGCLISPVRVARKLYQLRHGILPSEVFVCHTCDTPRCILDEHHFPGTALDNSRDAAAKGRMRKSDATKAKMIASAFRRHVRDVRDGKSWWLDYERSQSRHRELLRLIAERKRVRN